MEMALDGTAAARGWQPGVELPLHAGGRATAEMEFFAQPLPEIGRVLSAHSTLKVGEQPRSRAKRLAQLGVWLGGGLALLWLAWTYVLFFVIPALVLLIMGWAFFVQSRFRHVCTFVGGQGVARATLLDARGNRPTRELLLFQDATELRASETRRYRNRLYQGTDYVYVWTAGEGAERFRIQGVHQGEKNAPEPGDNYHFAVAAEAAWSVYQFGRMMKGLEEQGYVEFAAGGDNAVRIMPGAMEFHFRGRIERLTPADVKTFTIQNGVFSVRHNDARWFGSAGKFDFAYGKVANARLFLLALQKLVGLSF